MNLRYTRHDRELSQVTILRCDDDNGWTIETRRESASVTGPRRVPESVAARLIEFEDYGFALVRQTKRRTAQKG